MGVPFDVNETCEKVTGGFATVATCWERWTESEANAPEDGRILNRVYSDLRLQHLHYPVTALRVLAHYTVDTLATCNMENGLACGVFGE
jgi:hypothetical protein